MSLKIDIANVTAVLLADGWHDVEEGTFDVDAYEFVDGYIAERDKGAPDAQSSDRSGVVSATGFRFIEQKKIDDWETTLEWAAKAEAVGREYVEVIGPLTAILAVRGRWPTKSGPAFLDPDPQ